MAETMMEKMFHTAVRIERLIWLPGIGCAAPEDFEEFCEELPDDEGDTLYQQIPCLKRFADEDEEREPDAVLDAINWSEIGGFVFQAATPVMKPSPTGSSYSWGHYYTKWMYAATEAEMCDRAVAWAGEQRAMECANAA